MKAVLDACVLFPTVMREMLLGAARLGAFEPIWSARILEEWARAFRRHQDGSEQAARIEIALLRAEWPQAEVDADPTIGTLPVLPDLNDQHVVATSRAAGAGEIVTMNLRDFPSRILTPIGLIPRHPDGFLLEIHANDIDLGPTAEHLRAAMPDTDGDNPTLRQFLKRAQLPRLAKALSTG